MHAGGRGDYGGEKRNVLIASVLLPIAVNFEGEHVKEREGACVKSACLFWGFLEKKLEGEVNRH